MGGKNLKYILLFLSSTVITYYFRHFLMGAKLGKSGWQYNKHAISHIPLPTIDKISFMADKISDAINDLLIINDDPGTSNKDVNKLGKKVDALMANIYNLNDIEIRTIYKT